MYRHLNDIVKGIGCCILGAMLTLLLLWKQNEKNLPEFDLIAYSDQFNLTCKVLYFFICVICNEIFVKILITF